jgi:hypothetical protein
VIPGNLRADTEEEKKFATESWGVFNTMSGTSPPTHHPLPEMPFPLPGNKGVENFRAAAKCIKPESLIGNRKTWQLREAEKYRFPLHLTCTKISFGFVGSK